MTKVDSDEKEEEDQEEEDEEEDELLLSPESARKRREEEKMAIELAREQEADRSERKGKDKASQESSGRFDGESSVIYSYTDPRNWALWNLKSCVAMAVADELDAPENSARGRYTTSRSPTKAQYQTRQVLHDAHHTAAHGQGQGQEANPSPARTSQQTRILSMIEEAARAKSVVDKMNFDDLMSLMRNVEELRGAAQANLQNRAEKSRKRR
jgi:hypothetical protein